jgi:pimeloyl-ACP methyl ester carboxylesterase
MSVTIFTGGDYKDRRAMTIQSRRFRARGNGLELSAVEWTPPSPRATCLLLHGFMDAAESFDLVAPKLAAGANVRVVAPDLRGFGHSDRVTGGGYYHFPDYVADVDALVSAMPGKLLVVGHSMGGTIATLFASARPERVEKLAVLEGLGPPDNADDVAPMRMRKWLEEMTSPPVSVAMTEEDALRRLTTAHPRVPREVLASRLPFLTVKDASAPDKIVWRYDPVHRTTSPMPFFARVHAAFAARVECPVLHVTGGPLGWRVPDEDARLSAFTNVKRADIDGAGHMMHWTAPEALTKLLVDFLA